MELLFEKLPAKRMYPSRRSRACSIAAVSSVKLRATASSRPPADSVTTGFAARQPATSPWRTPGGKQIPVDSPYDVAILNGMFASARRKQLRSVAHAASDGSQIRRKLLADAPAKRRAGGGRPHQHRDPPHLPRAGTGRAFLSSWSVTAFKGEPVNYLYCDSRPTSCQAIEHPDLQLGHRRIAIAAQPHRRPRSTTIASPEYEARLLVAITRARDSIKAWSIASGPSGPMACAKVIRHLMSIPDRPTRHLYCRSACRCRRDQPGSRDGREDPAGCLHRRLR